MTHGVQNDENIHVKGKVAYLGPGGTFSNQAALKIVKAKQLVPFETIYHIFQAVANGTVGFGVVPAENSTEGTIRETLDYLIDLDLKTNGSIELAIHQNLLSKEKDVSKIKKVISHPQALAQCKNWLHQNLPEVKLETSKSTISAIDEEKNNTGVGFICPSIAAKLYGLDILSQSIEDNRSNVTKFYIISKNLKNVRTSKKTLLFLTVFNRVGILRDILNVFASLGINLSKLESRPSREKVWDYHFFIEVEVSMDDEKLIESLNILKQYCPVIKVLGGV